MDSDSPRAARDRDAAAAAAAIASGQEPPTGEFEALRRDLLRLARRTSSAGHTELDDVVDAALESFVAASNSGRVEAHRALKYARAIVRNEIRDRARQAQRRGTVDDTFDLNSVADRGDDAIARMISQFDSARQVEAILQRAARDGDVTTTRVLNAYLTLAQRRNNSPTSRQVAHVARVSHWTVQQVLRQLRPTVDAEDVEP